MRILFFSLFLLALASCSKKEKQTVLNRQMLPSQNFVIDPAKDTVIVTKGQCKMSILKGTFGGNDAVTIEKEISDMKLDNFEFEIRHRKPETKLLINERLYRFECPQRHERDSTTKKPGAASADIMIQPSPKLIDEEP